MSEACTHAFGTPTTYLHGRLRRVRTNSIAFDCGLLAWMCDRERARMNVSSMCAYFYFKTL